MTQSILLDIKKPTSVDSVMRKFSRMYEILNSIFATVLLEKEKKKLLKYQVQTRKLKNKITRIKM